MASSRAPAPGEPPMNSTAPTAALDLAPSPLLTQLKEGVRKLREFVDARDAANTHAWAWKVGVRADRYSEEQNIPDPDTEDHPYREIDTGLGAIYDLSLEGNWEEIDRRLEVGEARLGLDKDKDTEYTGGRKHRRTTRKRKGKTHRRATRRR